METPAGVLAAFPAGLHPSSSFEAQHLREGTPDVPTATAAPGAFAVTPPVSGEQQQQQERSPQRHTWVPHGLVSGLGLPALASQLLQQRRRIDVGIALEVERLGYADSSVSKACAASFFA